MAAGPQPDQFEDNLGDAFSTFALFTDAIDDPPLRIGDARNEQIVGTGAAEAFDVRQGDYIVRASGGNDIVVASAGDDTVFGGARDDTLSGEAGDTQLRLPDDTDDRQAEFEIVERLRTQESGPVTGALAGVLMQRFDI